MSFILDALKKLEDKRQSESVPDLTTVHIEGGSKQGNRPVLVYLLVAVLVLNALVIAVWLRPQEKENNAFIAQTAKESIKKPAPTAQKGGEENVENEILPKQEAVETADDPEIAIKEQQEIPVTETATLSLSPSPDEIRDLKSRMAEEQLLITDSPSLEPVIEEEIKNADERRVLDITQLPLDIRKGLPDLTVTGHIYSNNPRSRVVNINGDVIREGETVTAGLKVNEITMSGVVFDYEGMLFSVRAF